MEYMKPELEIEEFDIMDVITASAGGSGYNQGIAGSELNDTFDGNSIGDFDFQGEFVF